jgi:hypothetical protein
MEDFDCEKFEHRLKNLKDTQDSITGLSKWCLNKRTAHKSIVKCWLKVLKEGKINKNILTGSCTKNVAFNCYFS